MIYLLLVLSVWTMISIIIIERLRTEIEILKEDVEAADSKKHRADYLDGFNAGWDQGVATGKRWQLADSKITHDASLLWYGDVPVNKLINDLSISIGINGEPGVPLLTKLVERVRAETLQGPKASQPLATMNVVE